jgi:acyl-CoA synthetase (AMP-forming)/AMP-acid ligase II/aminoglycoside N3'-acetyltransferase/acyl carrier protein
LTVGDLLKAGDRIAARLQRAFPGKSGLKVAMVMPTGENLLASMVACWRLGAMACPLDIGIQPKRFIACLTQFEPDVVLFAPHLDGLADLTAACQGEGWPAIEYECCREAPDYAPGLPQVNPSDPALCIFTSGSTGLPKGVILSHKALLAGVDNVMAATGIRPSDRALCVLPLSHLNGLVTTFLSPLASGGSVVFLQGAFSPREVLSLIDRFSCTWLSAVPTQISLLTRPPLPRSEFSLETLRFCRSASAPLSARVLAAFEAHYGVPVIESMGMTETAGQIFSNALPPGVRKPGSIGCPVGFSARLIDDTGAICPDGVVGEIEVCGPALMSGYVNAAEETAKAYNGPWLKSGDLAERDAQGYYFIRGRKKEIAIFSGLNISLRFLDTVIEALENVPPAVCLAEENDLFGEVIVIYAENDPSATEADVAAWNKRYCDAVLPFLPSPQALREVRFIASLPRSAVGKPLKGLLVQCPVLSHASRPLPHDARGLLAEVLHISPEEVHDKMGLGLTHGWDSLTHFMLLLAVEDVLQRRLEAEEILALTTFAGLASLLSATAPLKKAAPPVSVAAGTEDLRAREDLTALMAWNLTLPSEDDGFALRESARPRRVCAPLTFSGLTATLRQAGISAGDVLLLHSDVAALGPTEGGFDREAVLAFYLKAFMTVLTEKGTLCVCTSFEDYGRYGVPFVREASPSRLGAFSEYLRTRPGTVRSSHPIVSVAAHGARAEELCGGPHYDGFGYDSPWGRLHRANAKIMSIGMADYPETGLTFLHYIEHCYGVPYQYTKIYSTPVYSNGQQIDGPFTMSVRYLDFGVAYDNKKFQKLLLDKGRGREFQVGQSSLFCTTCDAMMSEAIDCLRADRYYFLASPPRFRPGVIPMDGGTGKLTREYDKGE